MGNTFGMVVEAGVGKEVYIDDMKMDEMYNDEYMDEMYSEIGMEESGSSFVPMQSAVFVFGIMAGVLALSVGLGCLFAKLKIKKGLNVYED